MPTLTAEQIEIVRLMTGDDCAPYDVSDAQMQYLYDNQAATAPLCMSGDPLGGLRYWVLKARLARAVKLFDETDNGSGITRKLSQKYEHIEALLTQSADECGFGGGVASISTLDLGIDRDCDVSENGRYPYVYGGWL